MAVVAEETRDDLEEHVKSDKVAVITVDACDSYKAGHP